MKYIGGYWKTRAESEESVIDRMQLFLTWLNSFNSNLFSNWYTLGRTQKEALKNRINADSKKELKQIMHKENKIVGSGYRGRLWNGKTIGEEAASISWNIGCAHHEIPNNIIFRVPYQKKFQDELNDEGIRQELIDKIVEVFAPDTVKTDGKVLYERDRLSS